jgi:hypothetical protein
MKRAFWKVVLILTLCVIVLGFYRGWFTISSHSRETQDNKVDVTLTVDPDRVKEDAKKVKEKTAELAGKTADEAKELGDRASNKVKSTDP